MKDIRMLAIDPSLNRTGWAIIDYKEKTNSFRLIDYGYIDCKHYDAELEEDMKLEHIYKTIERLLRQYKPTVAIAESPFYSRNPKTLMRLSHVHGTLLLVCKLHGLSMDYYAPLTIKSTVLKGIKTKNEDGTKKKGNEMKKEVEAVVFTVFPQSTFIKDYTDDVTDAISVGLTYVYKDGTGTLKDNKAKARDKEEDGEKPKKKRTRKKKEE